MLSSSIRATLQGRFDASEYGLSKEAGEDLFFAYGEETGVKVLVYRFPNLAGKWVRPNYNSAVDTFCYNIAHDLPITVNDPPVEQELLFIDESGHGLIQERKIGTDEVLEFEVSGEKIEAVHMLPGYTHNIINLLEMENLVTLMWANEQFDPEHPDTFGEKV